MALITVSGHLFDPSGAATAGSVTFQLTNYGASIPRVIGTNSVVATNISFVANSAGFWTGSIQGNDTIDPGATQSPPTTFYEVSFKDVSGNTIATLPFQFTGAGPANLDTQGPMNAVPQPFVPPNNAALLASSQTFTGNNTFQGTTTLGNTLVGTLTAGTGTATFSGPVAFTGLPNLNLYVATSGNGGSDSNDGLAPTVGGGHGPFLTVQHAALVALSYDFGGISPTINIGTGTFAGVQLSGPARGVTGAGISGQYLIFNGNGAANTTLTAFANNIVIEASNGIAIQVQNVNLSAPASGYGIFAQDAGTNVLFGNSTITGAANTSVAIHYEGGAFVQQATANTNLTLSGTFNVVISAGPGGCGQFGNTFTCTSLTGTTEFALVDAATLNFFATTSFSGAGSVTGARYYVRGNGLLANLSGSALPGNANGIVDSGGRYRPSPVFTAASTGLGTNGSVTVAAGSGTHGGLLTLNTGTASTGSSGVLSFAWPEFNYITNGGALAPCVAIPMTGASSWAAGATTQINANSAGGGLSIIWYNNGTNLTTNTTYQIVYVCNGDV